MIKSLALRFLLLAVGFQLLIVSSQAQRANTLNSTPQEAYERVINNPAFKESPKGEGFCWQARGGMGQFISNYEATKNTEWLDAGFRYCDFLISRMEL